jgi:flagellin
MQLVDGSLSEAIDIVNTIRIKAVQGAQDTLSFSSRSSLQQDIDTLLGELDQLIDTSVFNDQKLLSGLFSNKKFQIGAYANEEVNVSLPAANETKIGHLGTGALTLTSRNGGSVNFNFTNPKTGQTLNISSLTVSYSNDAQKGMGGLADYINRYTSDTGISAIAEVESASSTAVGAGATSALFAINDIAIGAVNVEAGDADRRLVNAINAKTASHGVAASINSSGQLLLKSSDGRAIKVAGIGSIGTSDDDISTYGQITILQNGPYQLNLSDLSEGFSVAFSANMKIAGDVTTTIDSTMAAGSVLGSGSTLLAGWSAGTPLSGADLSGDIVTTLPSTLYAGSVLASGSSIAAGSRLGGTAATAGSILSQDLSVLQSDSVLLSGSIIKKGSYLTNDIITASGTTNAGTVLSADATLTSDLTLTYDMLLLAGSSLAPSSTFTAGSFIGADFTINGPLDLTAEMTLLFASSIADVDASTLIAAGSSVGGNAVIATSKTLTQEMMVKSGSTLSSASQFAIGSTIGGSSVLAGAHLTIEDLLVESGSTLAASSLIINGTVATTTLQTITGTVPSGTTLKSDQLTIGSNTLSSSMLLKSGSILADGSALAANSRNDAGVEVTGQSLLRLLDLSVLTVKDASTAIVIADAALADLERIRAEAGAYQGQFESSISLLGETEMHVSEARSKMIEVDFANEVENLTRMQLLVQSSAFALTQANAAPQNVFRILQGGADQKFTDFFISAASRSMFDN